MGKVKEYYQEQINNGSYYESPEIEYYMKYSGKYGRWIPSLINWYNKMFMKVNAIKVKKVEPKKIDIPF